MKKQQKTSIFSKISQSLKTPKGRLVATIAIFAIIGGGIFVYRSFAAVIYATPYGRGFGPYTYGAGLGCVSTDVNDTDIFGNSIPVVSLACPYSSKTGSSAPFAYFESVGAATVNATDAKWGKNHTYEACVDFKGSGRLQVSLVLNNGAQTVSSGDVNFSNNPYGNLFCGARVRVTTAGPIKAKVTASSKAATWINVRNVQIRRLD